MMIEDKELQAIYDVTCKERLRKLRDGLLRLENDLHDAVTLEELRREIHSLKGDSRSVGIEPIALLSQQIELVLQRIQHQETIFNATLRDRLFDGLQIIEVLVHEAVTGEPSNVDVEQALTQLVALAASASPEILSTEILAPKILSPRLRLAELLAPASAPPAIAPSFEPPMGLTTTVGSKESSLFIEDQELREIYKTTSLERLHQLEVDLRQLAASPTGETMPAELLRQIHSLKGDARSIGLESIFLLAQQVESIFRAIQRQDISLTPAVSDRLAQGLAALKRLVNEAVMGKPSQVEMGSILSLLSDVTPQMLTLEPEGAVKSRWSVAPSSCLIGDNELREIYRATSEERLRNLETVLLEVANHPDPTAVLETMQRQLHSLKGDSRSVGLDTVSMIAQQLEAIVNHLQTQDLTLTFEVSENLSQGLHVVRGLVDEAVTGIPSNINVEQVLSQLIAVLESSALTRDVAAPISSSSQPHDAVDTVPPLIEDVGAEPSKGAPLIEEEELREIYRTTSEERLQRLEMSLLHLEQHPDDHAILAELRREAHSLKGDSRSLGVDAIAGLMHQVEEILERIQRQSLALTSEISDRLYLTLDGVKHLLHTAVTGEPNAVDVADVSQRLIQLIVNSPAPATTASQSQQPAALQRETALPIAGGVIVDPELREIYKVTSEERLQRLEAGLVYLEQHPDDLSRIAELMREVHSLKGDAGTTGVEPVEVVSHQFEDVLTHIQRQTLALTPEVSDRLYQSLDAMRQFVHTAVTGEPSLFNPTLVLNQLLEIVPAAVTDREAVLPAAPDLPNLLPTSALTTAASRIDTIRVPTRNLDALIAQTEELTITKIQSAQITKQAEQVETLWQEWKVRRRSNPTVVSGSLKADPYDEQFEELISELRRSIEENSTKLERLAEELTDNIRTLRRLPLSTVLQTFPRMVRDLAKQQSKSIELIIEGEETTADKQLLEGIQDALLHLIRNAIDHGIETPAERERVGKPAIAKISLKGYQTLNSFVIEVSDDGRGLDVEQIKQTAIRRKIHTSDELEQMTPNQIYGLIMASGFSTRTFITEISGRGVGLDVVRTNVERLNGNIQIESTRNQGCTFRLQLSTTLTTANVILLDIQGIIHAIPFEFLYTTVTVSPEQIELVEGREVIQLNGRSVPVANLIDTLELIQSPAYALANKLQQIRSERLSCVVLKVGDEQAGFFVDRLLDTQEVVLKPQSQILKRVRNIMGATTLGTGEVCMILNPPDLIRSLQKPVKAHFKDHLPESAQRKSVILLVEDSLPVRTQEKRLFENAGYEVVVAIDGLDGYNKLKTQKFDAVVSDVEMPNLDGLSLTAKIRQDRQYDELPIILVTTLSSEDDRRRGAEAGANAYIPKGKFNQEALLETLTRLV